MLLSKIQKEYVELEQKIEEVSLLSNDNGLRAKIISRAKNSHGEVTVQELAVECRSSVMWKGCLPDWAMV